MTFTLPEDLAALFLRRIPARQRSRYVAEAVGDKLAGRDRQLLRACEIANRDPEVRAIEKEFDAISGEIAEPWTDAPSEPRTRPPSRPPTRRSLVGPTRSRPRGGN